MIGWSSTNQHSALIWKPILEDYSDEEPFDAFLLVGRQESDTCGFRHYQEKHSVRIGQYSSNILSNILSQWCWWQRYVAYFMMVTDLRCWWQNHYVGDRIIMLMTFFVMLVILSMNLICQQHLKLVANTFVSNIRHQHRCHLYLPYIQWISMRVEFVIEGLLTL